MTRINRLHIAVYSLILVVLLNLPNSAISQDMPVPVYNQFPIFIKILPFDRNLSRFGKKINFYIVYQSNFRTSLNTKNEVMSTVNSLKLYSSGSVAINYIPVDLSTDNFEYIMDKNGTGVVYFCPVRAINIKEITQYCRRKKLVSMTGIPEYMKEGVSVAIDRKGDKPEIVIDLSSVKSEGTDFSSQLLKLSTIID